MKADVDNRRAHGVVYTPQTVADAIVAVSHARSTRIATALEPSCGDGAFLHALRERCGPGTHLTAVDIDAKALHAASAVDASTELVLQDFLVFAESPERQNKYDLIIGNPPYVRRHNFSDPLKQSVASLSIKTGYPLGQLKNSWAAFVVAAHGLLTEEGTLSFVVPYELITVAYGKFLRDWLASRFRRIDIFIPDEKAFKKIDQDAVVLLATNAPGNVSGVNLCRVSSLEELSYNDHAEPAQANGSIEDKSFLLNAETRELLHRLRVDAKCIGDACTSVAGTVTAANDYFILSHKDVDSYELWPWARPILKKGALVSSMPIFETEHYRALTATEPTYLIDFCKAGSPPLDDRATKYIERGEQLGLNERYKSRYRTPWYRIPVVAPTEGLFFKRSHRLPKLCINRAGVLATDTAYQVSPKNDHTMEGICFSFYNSLTAVFCEIDGRFYGGGVLELTPKEFRGLPLWYRQPNPADFREFELAFGTPGEVISLGDRRLSFELKLTSADNEKISNALSTLQDHRLRHGRAPAINKQ